MVFWLGLVRMGTRSKPGRMTRRSGIERWRVVLSLSVPTIRYLMNAGASTAFVGPISGCIEGTRLHLDNDFTEVLSRFEMFECFRSVFESENRIDLRFDRVMVDELH